MLRNSLISSGCIINGQVERFQYCLRRYLLVIIVYIKNSIILNDVYLGDNIHIENCIVESRDTIRANSYHCGEDGIKIVVEKNDKICSVTKF
jgi:glucose-1-phosphate adenylyltransferase